MVIDVARRGRHDAKELSRPARRVRFESESEKEREREALNAAAQTQSVGSNADRLNVFKSRLQVAKRQAKRDKRNRAATPGSLSAVSQSPRTAAESAPPTSEPSRLATAATRTDAVVRIVEVS